MISRLRHRWIHRNADLRELRELNEMLTKFGRRVTHDLDHAISHLGMTCGRNDLFLLDRLRAKSEVWHAVFYSDGGAKDYRSQIYDECEKLEKEVERLKKLCVQHGIDPADPDGVPF